MNHRQKYSVTCSISLLLLILFDLVVAYPASKTYSIDKIDIQAEILRDGSLFITENRSYTFRGNFSWADYSLPLKNLGRITDFMLSENDMVYRQDSGKDPGTYQYFQDHKKLYVKWFYRATNESRTFTLKYRVEDAVTVYNDIAELYFKFVSEESEKSINSVPVLIKFPQVADTSLVRAWAHGPLHGQLAFESGMVRLWVSPLPKRNWWEVRTIFPVDWVPLVQKRRNEFRKEQIMHEEQLLVAQSNAKRLQLLKRKEFKEKHEQTSIELSLFLAVLGLATLVYLYNRYGKSYPVPFYNKISSDIPEQVSPAIASYIYNTGYIGAGALVATMFDLARRGFLTIEEIQLAKKSIFGTYQQKKYKLKLIRSVFENNSNKLTVYERDMIQFLFQDLAAGSNEIDFDEIKHSNSQVMKWFSNWKKMIKNEWGNRPFYDKSSVTATVISTIFSIIIIASGILITIYFGVPGAVAVVAGIVLFGVSFIILRYTNEVKLLRSKLLALKQYLKSYHFKKDDGNFQLSVERFLIYGVALGVSSKVMKELLSTIPEWQSSSYFAWYAGTMSHGSSAGFADAVTSMVSAVNTTMGTAAGVGGGASVGGGAGAGGASGGAG